MATRSELIETVAKRYHAGTRSEKKDILDEFVKVTGFHRKHSIRVLKKTRVSPGMPKPPPRSRLYDEAAEAALIILWEAADRMCGKRLSSGDRLRLPKLEGVADLSLHLHRSTPQRDAEAIRRIREILWPHDPERQWTPRPVGSCCRGCDARQADDGEQMRASWLTFPGN
jgi:hypothetical protein